MTNKQKAQELIALVLDVDRPTPERTAALAELNALKKKAKCAWSALLGHQPTGSDDPNTWDDVKDLVNQAGFEATAEELAAQKTRQDVKAEKDPLDEELPPEVVEQISKVAKATAQATVDGVKALAAAMAPPESLPPAKTGPKGPKKDRKADDLRGLISEMSRKLLLETDDPYADICEAIKAKYPHAVTTPRSLASVASEMRKGGNPVPQRRKPAKAKG